MLRLDQRVAFSINLGNDEAVDREFSKRMRGCVNPSWESLGPALF